MIVMEKTVGALDKVTSALWLLFGKNVVLVALLDLDLSVWRKHWIKRKMAPQAKDMM